MSKTTDKTAVVAFVQITDCCCGVAHRMKQASWDTYRQSVKGKRSTVPVGNGVTGCWRVPRIFIACHGLLAAALPALAAKYEWEEVRP